MWLTITPSDAIEVLVLLIGVILVIKRLADMDKYYEVRLIVISLILSGIAILFFIGYGLGAAGRFNTNCTEGHYCMTEM